MPAGCLDIEHLKYDYGNYFSLVYVQQKNEGKSVLRDSVYAAARVTANSGRLPAAYAAWAEKLDRAVCRMAVLGAHHFLLGSCSHRVRGRRFSARLSDNEDRHQCD